MESLIYLLDFNEDEMARKVVLHKRNCGGLEAPRNSMELPIEASYELYAARDNILYAHHMTKGSSGEDYHSTGAPLKKLIHEEVSGRPSTRSNSPSVVARLMGVDVLPFDSKPGAQLVCVKNGSQMDKLKDKNRSKPGAELVGVKNGSQMDKLKDKNRPKKGSVGHILSNSNCSQQLEVGPIGLYVDGYPDQYSRWTKSKKPKPREHPQEEELQKFKKEFEAWQATRFSDCSNLVKFVSPPPELIAQEELNRENMYLYANSNRITRSESLREHNDFAELNDPHEMLAFERVRKKGSCYSDEENNSVYPNTVTRTNSGASQLASSVPELDIVSAPSKIVILRPGPDRVDINEDLWSNTPSTSEGIGTIEDFLKEVKERLNSDLQGNWSKRSTTVRGGGIETPYSEKQSKPREIAHCIAQEVRDSVSRDIEMNLLRSESTRSYRSEIQNGAGSPELAKRDTRKFLAESLRNVLKGEKYGRLPTVVYNSSTISMSDFDKGKPGHLKGTCIGNKMSHPDSYANELQKHSWSSRGEPDEVGMPQTDMSPMNLARSLSAPVSGTSFGKLLLEDRHILNGVQVRRKHEATEKVSMNINKQKKDKFSIREKVSSFRYNLTLRGRLFRKRVKSVEGSSQNKHHHLKDSQNGQSAMMSFCDTHGNSTEVPPSPASVCSSVHEEFWRSTDYLSPISSLGGQLEDSEMSHVFREINSNLSDLRRKLDQLEGACLEDTLDEPQTTEVDADIEDQSEAYIRDLLVTSGLFDGSFNRSLSKWNPLGKPISTRVFEEVEETCKESNKDKDQYENINHKMIVDMLNEVLPSILREPVNISRYMEKVLGLVHNPPNGRKLLSLVWNSIRVHVHPPVDRSYYALDNMLARDLNSSPWSRLVDDDVNALAREIECQIIGGMIEKIVKDMYS